ncbi:MAG: helix-turn-helix transcriptional regulator [Oscillospiraceae bacterium]
MTTMDLHQIGARIRLHRINLGYTRESLSEKIGVTPKFCADIERGDRGMSLHTLCLLAETLQLSTDYILFGPSASYHECETLSAMMRQCPPNKAVYAIEILRTFLNAIN